MNIFRRELKAHATALVIWCVCMVLLVISGMAKYTAYTSAGASGVRSINDILKAMPFSLRALLGFGSFDVTTMAGYFAVLTVYTALVFAIHAALLGAGIIAKEERDKTAEYLMVKPVSRAAVVTAKLSAALVNAVVLNAVTLVSMLLIVPAYNKGKDISAEIAVTYLSLLIVQLIFLSLGAAVAALMRNPKGAGSVTTGIVLIGYIAARVTDMTDKLNALNVISPFKYFDMAKILAGRGLDPAAVLLSLALAAAFVAATYFFYAKRDMKI